ncbi:MAG: barstar family protein [Candidatus Sulfotelmatobacter sp.]|jgi:RNAse (barnase) inhibitor barstar
MTELILDASTWKTRDDVYTSFFKAVGAPEWHGRNLDALNDSISTGGINAVEVPYKLVIQHYGRVAPGAKQMADNFVDLVREIAGRGCPVEIVLRRL